MKKRRKNYYRLIILNVEGTDSQNKLCYCFDLGFLPVSLKNNNNNNNNKIRKV